MTYRPGGLGGGISAEDDWSRGRQQLPASNDPEQWVEEHGDVLYRYALARVRKPEVAQDLVQETLLAAMRGYEKFAGHRGAQLALRNFEAQALRITYRKLGRETSFTDLEFLSDECARPFRPGGILGAHERTEGMETGPDEVMHRGRVLADDARVSWQTTGADRYRFHDARNGRRGEQGNLLDPRDKESNLWVMLHRARMALRDCLATNWFEKPGCTANDAMADVEKLEAMEAESATSGRHLSVSRASQLVAVASRAPHYHHYAAVPGGDAAAFGKHGEAAAAADAGQVRIHYLMCSFCERYARQLLAMRRLAGEFPEKIGEASEEKLPPDVKERMREALRTPL